MKITIPLLPYPLTDRQKRDLAIVQRGRCAVCGRKSEDLVEDHDHDTGVVRGLLCTTCNTGIGMLGDSLARVQSAAEYLSPFKPVHDPKMLDVEQVVRLRPATHLCPGSYMPPESIPVKSGPGLFRCAECDRADIRVVRVGTRNWPIYMTRGHYKRNEAPRPRGLGKQRNLVGSV